MLTFKNNGGCLLKVWFFLSEQIIAKRSCQGFCFQSDILGFIFFPPLLSYLFILVLGFLALFSASGSSLCLLIGQLEQLLAAYLLEWEDLITEHQEQALAES